MDFHDRIHYAAHGLIAVAIVAVTAIGARAITPRPIHGAWPPLPAATQQAIVARLSDITPASVQIRCPRLDCRDLAADLEDVFLSAHWRVVSVPEDIPWAPRDGIGVGPSTGTSAHADLTRLLAGILNDQHLRAVPFETGDTGDMVIVIGRNPK
jgi:hypothetical protein